jgi:hypothetical protein
MKILCWCNYRGVIGLGMAAPASTILITYADVRLLRAIVSRLATAPYEGDTLLVPGVAEAASLDDKLIAAAAFAGRVVAALEARKRGIA